MDNQAFRKIEEGTQQAHVDLNSDIAESFGRYTLGLDEQIIPLVSSVNIACGMHAGDPCVMRKTVRCAKEAGVAIGAHPGYPDLQGFGRRDLNLSSDEVYAFVLYQIGALDAFCKAEHTMLHHVKPHGQLYNRAAKDKSCAQAIVAAIKDYNPALTLVGLSGSLLCSCAEEAGLPCAHEFFADRNYTDEGSLVPRSDKRAVITDAQYATKRCIRAIQTGYLQSVSGAPVHVRIDTICTHGDTKQAVEFVASLRTALTAAGIAIRAC